MQLLSKQMGGDWLLTSRAHHTRPRLRPGAPGRNGCLLTTTQAPVASRPKPSAQRLHLPRELQPLMSQF